jgi:hypothetical protein
MPEWHKLEYKWNEAIVPETVYGTREIGQPSITTGITVRRFYYHSHHTHDLDTIGH